MDKLSDDDELPSKKQKTTDVTKPQSLLATNTQETTTPYYTKDATDHNAIP